MAALDAAAFALAGAEHMKLAVGGLPRDQRADLPRPDIERGDDHFDARRRHAIIPRSPYWRPGLRRRRARRSASRAPPALRPAGVARNGRSEEHTSELQSLMRISYAVFCLKKKKTKHTQVHTHHTNITTQSNKRRAIEHTSRNVSITI